MSKVSAQQAVADRILVRVYLLFAGFLLFALAVVGQILYVQWGQGDRWRSMEANLRVYYKTVVADRGSILSDDGSVMAVTLPFYRLAMDVTVHDPKYFASYEDSLNAMCEGLARHFRQKGYSADYFKTKLLKARRNKDRHVYLFPVKKTLNYRELKALLQLPLLNQGRFRGGVIIEKVNNRRFYPFGNLARITLGFVANDTTGFKGIEFSYNEYLQGQNGSQLVQRLPGDVELPLSEYGGVEAQDGLDVVTTLNVHMQDVVETALRRAVVAHQAKGGVAILMEVATGEIKAMVNYPETYNYAVATLYEPGSTFKLASFLAALEDGYITPEDTVQTGQGYLQVSDRVLRDVGGYGKLSARQVFEKSSNVGTAKLILEHYADKPAEFLSRLNQLGVLGGTGIAIRGEPAPDIIRPTDSLWNATTLAWLSVGYNVRLTPLQVLTFYNSVANGGTRVAPQVVKELRRGSEVVQRFEPVVLQKRIASEKSIAIMQELMQGVVQRGTAATIRRTVYPIAGKTGTAQKLVGGEYLRRHRASFCGYFPADSPKYTCLILIDEPSEGGSYGGEVAAPVFKEIADRLYATDVSLSPGPEVLSAATKPLHYPITRTVHRETAISIYNLLSISVPEQPDADYVRTWQHGKVVKMSPQRLRPGIVPDVLGMSARDALALLENQGLRVRLRGHGKVRRQNLEPGKAFRRGETIELTLTY